MNTPFQNMHDENMKFVEKMEQEVYFCLSCDAEYTKEEWQKENPNKTGEPRGLCKWCRDLSRSFGGCKNG